MKLLVPLLCLAAAVPANLLAQGDGLGVETLRGGGLEITVDLTGWKRVLPASVLHDEYIRLGAFDYSPVGHLAILVDALPPGLTDAAGLCRKSQDHFRGSQILAQPSFAGKPGCLLLVPSEKGFSSLYLLQAVGGRWLEWHYSGPAGPEFAYQGRKRLEELMPSFSAKADSSGEKLPQSDLTEKEVTFVERQLNCAPNSTGPACRGLAAFKTGVRPQGRPKTVAVTGAVFRWRLGPGAAGGRLEDLGALGGYLLLSDTQMHVRMILPGLERNKKVLATADKLVSATEKFRKLPDNNAVEALAREVEAESSLPAAKLAGDRWS